MKACSSEHGREALTTDRGQVTGRDGDPRDPTTGLWPSDHAGVVMRVRRL
jgi:hypothetical protein